MNALYLESANAHPVYMTVPDPEPKAGESIIQILAASLNHRDLWIIKGQYAGMKLPVILGSCGCGMHKGKRVLIQPGFNWGEKQTYQSSDYHILGMPVNGTFAEYCRLPETMIYDCPGHFSHEEAAALPLAGLTAFRAVFTRGRLSAGQKVLISGVGGGVALFAMQFALAAGAEVWVTSGSEHKIEKAMKLGASGGVLYSEEDWFKQLKAKTGGFDLVIDSAAGDGFSRFTAMMNPGGTIVFYGGTRGVINKLNPQQVFWKQLNILGSTMGSPQEFQEMLHFVEKHQIRPVVDEVFKLENGVQAFQKMAESSQFGKIVLRIAP